MSKSGTQVTATDIQSGESGTRVIENDYCLITDGDCYVVGTQVHGNGTHVITIKHRDS